MSIDNSLKAVARKLIVTLKEVKIKAYIHHTATTGSIYIRFEDARIGSVRIGDHDGRERLKYKFNIRSDIPEESEGWVNDVEGLDSVCWRYYVRTDNWKKIIPVLWERSKTVKSYKKREYKKNKFKKKGK